MQEILAPSELSSSNISDLPLPGNGSAEALSGKSSAETRTAIEVIGSQKAEDMEMGRNAYATLNSISTLENSEAFLEVRPISLSF